MEIPELTRVQVGDLSIAYRRAGKGPPMVLLHGFLADSRCWRQQLTGLSGDFDVIAWDAPGGGASPDPPLSFGFSDWSRYLARFLDTIGVESAHLVGLSWGGVLAQVFYSMYPARVQSLVLADTYAGWKGSLPAAAVQQRLARCENDSRLSPAEFVPGCVPEMFTAGAPPELLEEMSAIFADRHPLGFRLMAKSLVDTDTNELLPRILCRTMILWGDDDRRSPLSIAEQLRSVIPGAEMQVIANAGHVSNMERPAEFNDRLKRFCLTS